MSDRLSDYIVIDTEGRRELKEIAVINSAGRLIYEAFNREHPNYLECGIPGKPLRTILTELTAIADNKTLIFHCAEHDLEVLKRSYRKVNLSVPNFSKVRCTYKLARQFFPNVCYSLEYLAKKLNLKVDRQYFDRGQAHLASYDARFTHQLYLAIQRTMTFTPTQNPFGSSRVDNPFQTHPDNTNVYRAQYSILESVIDDIKYDPNHQSKGAVVIGEPGTGKTHLIMRLAQQRLKRNRLLFIPCPNDANTIKYHIYSCILNSLNKPIPETGFNQLEYFLANTFVGIIKSSNDDTQRIQNILDRIKDNPLKLYDILGGEDTQTRRRNWDAIERFTHNWWLQKYGAAGYASEIIKGIVKFCRYSDPGYKQLVKKWLAADELEPEELDKIGLSSWHDEISKEDFSLDAIAVLGKLALLHEPLIIVFDQLEMLGLEHNRPILFNFGEAVKEIFTRVPHSLIIFNLFPHRWQQLQQIFDGSIIDRISQYQVFLEPPTTAQIEQILQLKAAAVGTDLNSLFSPSELSQIFDGNSIRRILNNAAEYFRYKYRNIPLPDRKKDSDPSNSPSSNPEWDRITSRLENLEAQQNRLEQLLSKIALAFDGFIVPQGNESNTTDSNHSSTPPQTTDVPPSMPKTLESKIRDYLTTQREILEQEYQEAEILIDEKDVGKLQDIIEAFKKISPLETDVLRTRRVLPPHRIVSNGNKSICIGFLSGCRGSQFTSRIQNFNEFVATKEQIKFLLWRDVRSDAIRRNTVGNREINQLKATKNGDFIELSRDNRITFELIYKFISDIYNRDLELNLDTELESALRILADRFQDYWLFKEIL